MAESAVLRAEKSTKNSSENADYQVAMAQLYLYNAVDTITSKAKMAIISFAEGDHQRMMLMGLKRFTKYQTMPNIVGLRNTIAEKVALENQYPF